MPYKSFISKKRCSLKLVRAFSWACTKNLTRVRFLVQARRVNPAFRQSYQQPMIFTTLSRLNRLTEKETAGSVLAAGSLLFTIKGAATATGGASAVLVGIIQKEALNSAIADTFLISAIPLFVCIPCVFLFIKRKTAKTKQKMVPAKETAL